MPDSIQKLLSFDFGLKRIGVASGQTLTCTAQPVTILQAQDGVPNWDEVEKLIEQWKPHAIVVGYPLNMNLSENDISIRAKRFANRIAGRFDIAVHLADERLSSRAVQDELDELGEGHRPNRRRIDDLAAVVILESWMRNHY